MSGMWLQVEVSGIERHGRSTMNSTQLETKENSETMNSKTLILGTMHPLARLYAKEKRKASASISCTDAIWPSEKNVV
jgi:hypothetical protein